MACGIEFVIKMSDMILHQKNVTVSSSQTRLKELAIQHQKNANDYPVRLVCSVRWVEKPNVSPGKHENTTKEQTPPMFNKDVPGDTGTRGKKPRRKEEDHSRSWG
jgi:hypothetical protein